MQKKVTLFLYCFLYINSLTAQSNIWSFEPVQVIGAFNSYNTEPYGLDYRTTTFRKLSITPGTTPTDGRNQWTTTINVQNSGGDIVPIDMIGGNGLGFKFVSGPIANPTYPNGRLQNTWRFAGIGQAALNSSNNPSYQATHDMGLNMLTPGYYTFVFNDCGYINNSDSLRFYVGYTSNAPVTVTRSSQFVNLDRSATIGITTSATPSPSEKIYVRYKSGNGDFGSSIFTTVEATGAGTAYSATIPTFPPNVNVYYYVYTSTIALTDLNARGINAAGGPLDVHLAAIRFDDNAGANYTYNSDLFLPLTSLQNFTATKSLNGNIINWKTSNEIGNAVYNLQVSSNGIVFTNLYTAIVNPLTVNTANYYSYTDTKKYFETVYYRLQVVENNGNIVYSKILHLKNNKNEVLVVAPQIANNIQIKTFVNEKSTLRIVNNIGQVIYTNSIEEGTIITEVPLNNYKGLLYLSIKNRIDGIISKTILIQ